MNSQIEQVIKNAIRQNRSIEITYRNFDGEYSRRIISDIQDPLNVFDQSYISQYKLDNSHITGFCRLRNEQRTFKIDRIIDAKLI